MHSIQTFLVIGGIMLLGILALTFYRIISSQDQISVHNSVIIDAVAIGQSLMSEIETKAFDSNSRDSLINNPMLFTAAGMLGPESGEAYPNFNDVDDFNNFIKTDTVKDIGVFRTRVNVKYVRTMAPDIVENAPTFTKAVYISVASPYTADTTKFTRVFSY